MAGRATLPKLALDNLWLVWGNGPVSEVEKWQQFEQRYGLFRAAGQPWPVGLPEVDANNLSYNCLLCHASEGTKDGEVWIGIGNNRLDLERFYSDIKQLAAIAEQAGLGAIDIPQQLDGVSQAPGAADGIGHAIRCAPTPGGTQTNIVTTQTLWGGTMSKADRLSLSTTHRHLAFQTKGTLMGTAFLSKNESHS